MKTGGQRRKTQRIEKSLNNFGGGLLEISHPSNFESKTKREGKVPKKVQRFLAPNLNLNLMSDYI